MTFKARVEEARKDKLARKNEQAKKRKKLSEKKKERLVKLGLLNKNPLYNVDTLQIDVIEKEQSQDYLDELLDFVELDSQADNELFPISGIT